MILTRLTLRNWRSYEYLDIPFERGLTLIEGRNGEGKTNIAEAIHYLSLARSWRSDDDLPLIKAGAETSFVRAYVQEGDMNRVVEIRLSKEGKRILLNEKPIKRLSELSAVTNVLLFSPEDTRLFVASPLSRRNFLDVSISKIDQVYMGLVANYRRLLQERNAALKADKKDATLIDVLAERLLETEKPIVERRESYTASLNAALPKVAERLFGKKTSLKVIYRPFLPSLDTFIEDGKKAYERCLEGDLMRKSTSIGIHREDFSVELSGKDVGIYGSQGENRLASIALKLTPYFLIEEPNKKPIVVLDDIYSELDEAHAENLSSLLLGLNQTFVTATKLDITGASYVDVADHIAKRRK